MPTARKPEDLDRLRAQGFHPVHLDVAHDESIDHATEEIRRQLGDRVAGVVNNAGFGQPGALEDLSRGALAHQFEVNVIGLQDFTNRFIPLMRDQGWGRIVNVSSVLGRVSLPFFGAYSASKFALEAMSDALRVELAGSGIAVSIIEPGPIATQFGDNAMETGKNALKNAASPFSSAYEKYLGDTARTPAARRLFEKEPVAVARTILHALESRHPKRRYMITAPAYFGAFMRRAAPAWFVDFVMKRRMAGRYR